MDSGLENVYVSTPDTIAESLIDAIGMHRGWYESTADVKLAFVTTWRRQEHWLDTALLLPEDFVDKKTGKKVGPDCYMLLKKYVYGEDIACKMYCDEQAELIRKWGGRFSSIYPAIFIRPTSHPDGGAIGAVIIDDLKLWCEKEGADVSLFELIAESGRTVKVTHGWIKQYNGLDYSYGIDPVTGGKYMDTSITAWTKRWIREYRSARITLDERPTLMIYTDSSFMNAGKKGTVVAYIVMCNGTMIACQTTTLKTIVLSAAEGEITSYAIGLQVGHGTALFMREIGLKPYPIIMITDSEATMKVIVTNKGTKRMKHIDLKIYSAQESFRRGMHIQKYMRGASLVVDAMTKTTNPESTQLTHLKAVLVGDF